jgi:hypothetical protein
MHLVENQRNMMSEIATLTRTVQKLNSLIQQQSKASDGVPGLTLQPLGPLLKADRSMPKFHDFLESRRMSGGSNATSSFHSRADSAGLMLSRTTSVRERARSDDGDDIKPQVRFKDHDASASTSVSAMVALDAITVEDAVGPVVKSSSVDVPYVDPEKIAADDTAGGSSRSGQDEISSPSVSDLKNSEVAVGQDNES